MAIRKVSFVPEEFYHIYNRGNSKQIIFHDKQDYERFVGLLYACNQTKSFKIDNLNKEQGLLDIFDKEKIVAIGAYVLMPNHLHILITQLKEGGVVKFMRKVMTAYAMYYNKKYKRTGALFEGRFKSEYIDNDRYLKYLFSYIHLNPVNLIDKDWKEKGIKNKTKALEFLNKYKHSSFVDFIEQERMENKILDRKAFPNYFSKSKNFIKEIMSWITYR